MSLFKAREWWTVNCGTSEEFDKGCMCVENVDNEPNGNVKIVVGSYQGVLRIYYPRQRDYRVEDLMLEQELEAPILQVAAGRFVPNLTTFAVAVLHPRKLCVYTVSAVGGTTGLPSYYTITKNYEHSFERVAFNFVYGPFGGVYDKDFICVQSMDGQLSIYEQDAFAFSRFLSNFLLPGPLCYAPKMDSFITFNSQLEIECYKYQMLAASSGDKSIAEEGGLTQSKKVQVDWSLNIGETVLDIQIARFSRSLAASQSDIVVLAERGLFCLKEQGSLRLQKRFDFLPQCFTSYHAGEEESGGGNQNIVVATHSKSLLIYKDMQLIWSAGAATVPVAIALGAFGGLGGMLVTLDDGGVLSVCYLGTDPPTNVVGAFESNKELNYEEMDEEHRRLLTIIKEATSETKADPPDRVTLRAQVPTRLDNLPVASEEDTGGEGADWRSRAITVRLFVSYTGQDSLENVTLTVSPVVPFVVSQDIISLPQLNGGRNTPVTIPLVFRCSPNALPTTTSCHVISTYMSTIGEPRTARCQINIPLCLLCRVVSPLKNATYKVTFDTNRMPPLLTSIFDDLCAASPFTIDTKSAGNVITFQFYSGPDVTILVSRNAGRYRIQSGSFEAMWLISHELCSRLTTYFERHTAPGEEVFQVSFQEALPLQDYFQLIDVHFKAREAVQQMNQLLSERAHQFRSIQKRLLVRFKDRNPAPLNNLDVLLAQTFQQLMELGKQMEQKQRSLQDASNKLAAGTKLILILMRYRFSMDDESYRLLETFLSSSVVDTAEQGWEECIDAAMTHLLRTSLAKSAKDTASAPMPLAPPTDTVRLKKHITLVCDRLAKGARVYRPPGTEKAGSSAALPGSPASMAIAPPSPGPSPKEGGPVPPFETDRAMNDGIDGAGDSGF